MATGPRYAVKFRRRREGKTNYHKRIALLKSGLPRLVVRKSNRYITCQVVQYNPKGDKTLVDINSLALKRLGWKHTFKSLPAAYATGFLAGLTANKAKVNKAVLDYGLFTVTKGSKIYATLKGFVDAGVKVNHKDDIFPNESRLSGEHISESVKNDFKVLKSKLSISK